jgi:hypothetical protein
VTTCNANYPAGAPPKECAHISLVEIDGTLAYKQALAYMATKDTRHAQQALGTLLAWANTNKVFGLHYRNGPLEAAWAAGALARAAEVLKYSRWSGFTKTHQKTVATWLQTILLPQMDYYSFVAVPIAINKGIPNIYSALAARGLGAARGPCAC